MNLLITGGAGFIGSALIRWLLSDNAKAEREALRLARVVNLDALTYAGNLANLASMADHPLYRFVHGDIADADTMRKVFSEYGITAVIHLAAETHVDRSIDQPAPFIRTNVEGTQVLLEAARQAWHAGAQHRFVHVSTDEVFGSLGPDDAPFTPTTAYAPNSPYAASKAASDHLARAYFRTYGLPVMTSNCSNNYGPHQFPEKLIPLMVLNALESRPLPVYGDGQQIRDWLFVDDHVRALVAILMKGTPGEVYTVGGDSQTQNIDVLKKLCRLLDAFHPKAGGGRYEDLIQHVKDRPGHDRRYAIDSAKIRRELGWAPRETLESGLGKTIDWYLANRAWCDAITNGTYRRERLGLG